MHAEGVLLRCQSTSETFIARLPPRREALTQLTVQAMGSCSSCEVQANLEHFETPVLVRGDLDRAVQDCVGHVL